MFKKHGGKKFEEDNGNDWKFGIRITESMMITPVIIIIIIILIMMMTNSR